MSFLMRKINILVLLLTVLCMTGCGSASSPVASGTTHLTPSATPASPTLYMLNEVSVRALDANNGTPRWSQSFPDKLNGYSMTVASGTIYVAEGTSLHAFDAKTGKAEWTGTTSGGIDTMTFLDQTIILTDGKTVYGYSSKDGSLTWRQNIPGDQSGLSNVSSSRHLFVENDLVYVWYGDALLALKAQSGTIVWQQSLSSQKASILDVDVTPDMLVVRTENFTVVYRASDGTQLWTTDQSDLTIHIENIHVVGNVVYMWSTQYQASNDSYVGTLSAVNLQDGTKQWSATDTTNTNASTRPLPAFSDTMFFLATGPTNGDLEARNLQDGHVIWTKPGAGTYETLLADGSVAYGYLERQGVVATSADKQQQLWLVQNLGSGIEMVNHHLYMTFTVNDVVATTPELSSIDPATGKALWTFTPTSSSGVVTIGPALQLILA